MNTHKKLKFKKNTFKRNKKFKRGGASEAIVNAPASEQPAGDVVTGAKLDPKVIVAEDKPSVLGAGNVGAGTKVGVSSATSEKSSANPAVVSNPGPPLPSPPASVSGAASEKSSVTPGGDPAVVSKPGPPLPPPPASVSSAASEKSSANPDIVSKSGPPLQPSQLNDSKICIDQSKLSDLIKEFDAASTSLKNVSEFYKKLNPIK
jgi:hypothetical protein